MAVFDPEYKHTGLDRIGNIEQYLVNANGGSRSALLTDSDAYLACVDSFTTKTLVGIDRVNDRMLVAGSTSLVQYTSLGTVGPSSDKTQPSGITANSARKLVLFKGNYYISGIETSSGLGAVWQAAPSSGNTAFSWTKVFTASAGSTSVISTAMNVVTDASGNDLALMFGEYADPTGGPQLWRTTDGSTWTSVFGPDASMRHFHCIAQDPFSPANVYATAGDGISKPILRSTDYGATWAVIVTDGNFQAVQISFSASLVWFAGDSTRGSGFVMDRATLTPKWLPDWHRYKAVPNPLPRNGGNVFTDGVTTNGSQTMTSATAAFANTFDKNDIGREVVLPGALFPKTYIVGINSSTSVKLSTLAQATLSAQTFVLGGDMFYASGFYGVVDPATGFFYFTANDNSAGGNRSALFVHTGQELILLDAFEQSITGNNQVSAEHQIYAGKLWIAGKSRPLLTASFNTLTLP